MFVNNISSASAENQRSNERYSISGENTRTMVRGFYLTRVRMALNCEMHVWNKEPPYTNSNGNHKQQIQYVSRITIHRDKRRQMYSKESTLRTLDRRDMANLLLFHCRANSKTISLSQWLTKKEEYTENPSNELCAIVALRQSNWHRKSKIYIDFSI